MSGSEKEGGSKASSNTVQQAPLQARKNIPGKRSDIGWKHGTDVDGNGRRVQCNYCAKIVRGVFRFKHHLAGTREDSEPCQTVPDEIKELMIKICAEAKVASQKRKGLVDIDEGDDDEGQQVHMPARGKKINSGGVQATLNQMMKKNIKGEVDEQVARFFYTSAIPFNAIKNPEFIKMCEEIGRYGVGYKPPSYHEVRETLLKQAVDRTEAMLEDFRAEWKKTGCTIMSDGWTDKKRRSICNFLVNSPKGTVFLYSLDTSEISKTTDKVFQMLDDVVNYVGEEHVVQVVTDNAANYKSAGEKLMEKRKNLYWTPCAAHCIDLILEDFEKNLKLHEVTIKKGRKLTTYIYSRSMLISMLKKFTGGKDLIRPGVTRFATAYLTLSCLNENKAGLMNLFSSDAWKACKFASTQDGKKIASTSMDSRFWKNIITCLKAAAPLIQVLRLVDSDEKPAMGFIYEAMDEAKEKIKSNFKDIKKSYEPLWEIIDKRWDKQLHRPLHAAAYYLNPSFHYDANFRDDDFEVKQGLFNCIERLVSDPEERNKISLQISEFHNAKGHFGLETAKNTRKKHLPAEWWDLYGSTCPELKKFAIRILSLTCSSSGCERNWSSFEMVHTKRRNRLHQKKMNDLVYVMYNLKLKNRQRRKDVAALSFEDVQSDDEWITEENLLEENVQQGDEEDMPSSSVDVVQMELGGSSGANDDLGLDMAVHVDDEEEEEDYDDEDNDDDEDEDNDDGDGGSSEI